MNIQPMLLIALVLPLAAVVALVPFFRQQRICASFAAAILLLVLILIFSLPGDTRISLAGLSLHLTPFLHLCLPALLAGSVLMLLAQISLPRAMLLPQATLLANGFIVGALLSAEQPVAFTILIVLAGVALLPATGSFSVQSGSPPAFRLSLAGRQYLMVVLLGGLALGIGFSLVALGMAGPDALVLSRIAAAALLVGFALRAGAAPFLFWLPVLAGPAQPLLAISLLVVLNLGVLAAFYIIQPFYTDLLLEERALLLVVISGLLTAISGALLALSSKNLKQFLLYAGINDLGYLILGLGTATMVGVTGMLFGLIHHLFATGLLTLCLAAITNNVERNTSAADRPLVYRFPLVSLGTAVALLSLLGFPPLAGFTGRWMIYQAAAANGYWLLLGALLATAIAAVSYVRLFHRLFLGEARALFPLAELGDRTAYGARSLTRPDRRAIDALIGLLLLGLLLLGLLPGLLLDTINSIVAQASYLRPP